MKNIINIDEQAKKIAQDIVEKLDGKVAIQSAPIPMPGVYMQTNKVPDITPLIDGIEAQHQKGIEAVQRAVEINLDKSMSRSWGWISGSRDIVDTGALKDSLEMNISSDSFSVSYNEPYANLVHYGGYINPYGNPNARVYLPGRPWVETTFSEMNDSWQQIYLSAV